MKTNSTTDPTVISSQRANSRGVMAQFSLLTFFAISIFAFSIIAFSLGCQPSPKNSAEALQEKSTGVIAVCYPLQFLTQQIAGETTQVTCILPPGEGKTWRPSRDDIRTLQRADLIIANGRGAQFAKWLDTVSLSQSKLCLTATNGLNLSDYIAVQDVVHSHGPEGEHSHSTMIAHTWLDPEIAKQQAAFIAEEMSRKFPQSRAVYATNLTNLNQRLDALSKLLEKTSKPNQRAVLTVNSDLKFFTRFSGLQDQHLAWSSQPELQVAESDIQNLLTKISSTNDKRDFVTDEANKKIILSTFPLEAELKNLLEKQGFEAIEINPLDHEPETGDYISVMTENLNRVNLVIDNSGINNSASHSSEPNTDSP